MEEREHSFSSVRKFVSFLSFSGTGQSLISSMIDAHKNAIVSRERKVLLYIYNGSMSVDQALKEISRSSAKYTVKGRMHKGSNSSHLVHNYFNGTAEFPTVVGDKCGQLNILSILNHNDFLNMLSSKLGIQLTFIHTYRNPFDVTAHMRKFYTKYTIDRAANNIANKFVSCDLAVEKAKKFFPVIDINFDNFVLDVPLHMKQILNFLDLEVDEDFLYACKDIVNPSLTHELDDIKWTRSSLEKINTLCNFIPYLSAYGQKALSHNL